MNRGILSALAISLLGLALLSPPGGAEESKGVAAASPPFFAMNVHMMDPAFAAPQPQAALIRELGYDGVQFLGTPEALRETLDAVASEKVKLYTAYLFPGGEINLDSEDPQYDPKMEEMIRMLAGSETLFLFGYSSTTFKPSDPAADARAVKAAQRLADFAAQHDVQIGIYAHVGHWTEKVQDSLRVVEQADRKNLGMAFSLYHWMCTDKERKLEPLVKASLPYLRLVTVNGSEPEGTYLNLDEGSYDVFPFVKAFHDAGYRGPYGMQCCGFQGDARVKLGASMEKWQEFMRKLAAEEN